MWNDETLKEKWKGPFQVLLAVKTSGRDFSHMAVKTSGRDSCIHYTWTKPAPNWETLHWAVQQTANPLQKRLKRNI